VLLTKESKGVDKMQKQYDMVDNIFKDILPKEDFNIRENQIKLCKHIYDVLNDRNISLSEAGVGIGRHMHI